MPTRKVVAVIELTHGCEQHGVADRTSTATCSHLKSCLQAVRGATQACMVLPYHCVVILRRITIKMPTAFIRGDDDGGLMLKNSERYVLTTGKASVIRNVLSLVLTEIKSEADVSPGTHQSLKAFAKNGCDRMVLDLRAVREPPVGIGSGVSNLKASYIGQVLVVTGEVSAPRILREIDALRRPHFSPQCLASALLTFIHMLF